MQKTLIYVSTLCLIVLFSSDSFPQEVEVTGKVFIDINQNGILDNGEPHIPGIPVSEGRKVTLANSEGNYQVNVNLARYPFVFITTPSGYRNTTPFWQRIAIQDKTHIVNFGLFSVPETNKPNFYFVQITDTHANPGLPEDVQEINSLPLKPGFVVATGDLVDNESIPQYKLYSKAVKEFNVPIYNVLGNHDYIENHRDFLGPDYYSYDYGQKHFIVLNCMDPQAQAEWLKNDLSIQPADRQLIVLQHYPPDKTQLDFFTKYNTRAFLHGHWHSDKMFNYEQIMVISTGPLCFGGIDCSPRGFRLITFKDNNITTEFRLSSVRQRLTIINPQKTANRDMPIMVAGYDTVGKVNKVEYQIDEQKKWNSMSHTGGWSWQDQYGLKKLQAGEHKLKIKITDDSGAIWEKTSVFNLTETSVTLPRPKSDWAGLLRDNRHNAVSEDIVKPPLYLAWAKYAGGKIWMSSPIVANNKVYISFQGNDKPENSGVTALSADDGKMLWKFNSDSAINGAPAYSNGVICAVSVVGTVHALDSNTGKKIWEYNLGEKCDRWVYNSPLICDNVLYCGVAPHFVALDLKSGKKLWQAKSMGTDWISCHTSPAADDKNIYFGSNGYEGLFALNKATGNFLWNKKENMRPTHSSPVCYDGAVYWITANILYGLKANTGEELWRTGITGGWSVSSPVVKDKVLVIGAPDGKVISVDRDNGKKSILYQTGPSIGSFSPYQRIRNEEVIMSSPAISGNTIYIGSNDGNFYALDITTGEKLWNYDLGVPILSSPAISGNGVFIATYDGNLYAFTSSVTKD